MGVGDPLKNYKREPTETFRTVNAFVSGISRMVYDHFSEELQV